MSTLSWSSWSVQTSKSQNIFPQDPSFKYDSTSQPKHDGVWSTFTISRHKHISINTGPVQNTNSHIFSSHQGAVPRILRPVQGIEQGDWCEWWWQPGVHLWQPHDYRGDNIVLNDNLSLLPKIYDYLVIAKVAMYFVCAQDSILQMNPAGDPHGILLASVRLRVPGIFVSISTKCFREGKVIWYMVIF